MKNPLIRSFVLAPLILLSTAFIIVHTILPRPHNPGYHSKILSQSRIIQDFPISPHFNLKDFASPHTHETETIPYVVSFPEKLQKKDLSKSMLMACGFRTSEHSYEVRGATYFCHSRGMTAGCYVSALDLAISAKFGFESGSYAALVYPTHVHCGRGDSAKYFGRCTLKGTNFDIYDCEQREDECWPLEAYQKVGEHPAGIVFNTFFYYTSEDDLIVDPMAGGGVTIDCCRLLNRRDLVYDIQPTRADIQFNDILQGYLPEAENCDLIFLDPSYYKKRETDYGKRSISPLNKGEYLQTFEVIARHSLRTIKPDGYLAFLMEPYIDYENSRNSIEVDEYIGRFRRAGWRVERIFDVLEPTQRYKSYDVERAKKKKQILTIRRELVIFGSG